MAPPRAYRVLTGPTASGKTDWLVRRAQTRPLAVISADSRQVYRHMDIGTGKLSTSVADTVPHFGVDLLNPLKKYSVYQYFHDASDWFHVLEGFEGEVWLSGGTGLFMRAVVEGLHFGSHPLQPEFRLQTLAMIEERGSCIVSQELDLVVGDPHNPRRVLRAVESALQDPERRALVSDYLGIPVEAARIEEPDYRSKDMEGWECTAIAVLDPGYAELQGRIERRVTGMFDAGLVEEAKQLVELGFGEADVVRTGIGYAEALAVLHGEMGREAAIERTIVRTRQYAKRQRTYFRGRGWPFYREDELPFD